MQTLSNDFDKLPLSPLSQYEVKGSKFLGFGVKIALVDSTNSAQSNPLQNALDILKQAHPKAVHFVYAFRSMNSLGQILERSSDDGEPKGSSGQPCLNVLRGWDLVDFGIIIVRYFGGVKLGVGGLVKAYSKATLEALNTLESSSFLIPFELEKQLHLRIKYSELNALKYVIKNHNLTIAHQEFLHQFVEITLRGGESNIALFNAWTKENQHLFM